MRDSIRRRVLLMMVGSAILVTPLAACGDADTGDVDAGGEPPATHTATSTRISTPTTVTAVSHGGPVMDYVSLVDALRAAGLTVNPGGDVSQPFLSVDGQTLEVDGGTVQVYEYPSEEAARDAAATFSPDASTAGTTMITWVDEPHVFQAGQLLVIYVGENEDILDALESALGEQVAGA